MWYWNAAGERYPLPERPLEPDEPRRNRQPRAMRSDTNDDDTREKRPAFFIRRQTTNYRAGNAPCSGTEGGDSR